MKKLPSSIKWIGFDLDDTLHFFKKSSGAASEAVFSYIGNAFSIPAEELRHSYKKILAAAQSTNFSEGKTSRQYRKERFGKLLEDFSVSAPLQLEEALDIYDEKLAKSLQLKDGALEALTASKRAGLSVMIITEGPQDAQVITIDRLGLAPFVDLLVTSAAEQVSKSDGLFSRAFEKAQCSPSEVIYIGDSIERDIIPTSQMGVLNFYVGDAEIKIPGTLKISNLHQIEELINELADERRSSAPDRGVAPA